MTSGEEMIALEILVCPSLLPQNPDYGKGRNPHVIDFETPPEEV